MADVDDLDPLLLAAVVDGEEVAAGEGEELGGAAALHRLGDQPAAVDRRLLIDLLRRHRGETSARSRPARGGRHGRRARRRGRSARPPPPTPGRARASPARGRAASRRRRACGRPACGASPAAGGSGARPPRGPCPSFAVAGAAGAAEPTSPIDAARCSRVRRPRRIASATSGSPAAACRVSPTRVRICSPTPCSRPIASAVRSSESIASCSRRARLAQPLAVGRAGEHLLLGRPQLLPDLEQVGDLVRLPHRELVDEPGGPARLPQSLDPSAAAAVTIAAQGLCELVPRRRELLERPVVERRPARHRRIAIDAGDLPN